MKLVDTTAALQLLLENPYDGSADSAEISIKEIIHFLILTDPAVFKGITKPAVYVAPDGNQSRDFAGKLASHSEHNREFLTLVKLQLDVYRQSGLSYGDNIIFGQPELYFLIEAQAEELKHELPDLVHFYNETHPGTDSDGDYNVSQLAEKKLGLAT